MIEMSETRKIQLAPLLREHIQNKINEKYDYTTATARKLDIQNFMELNKENLEKEITLNKVRSSHDPILKQLWKKSGNVSELERQHKGKNKLKFNSDMNKSNIDPKPQAGKSDESPKQQGNLTQPIPEIAIQAYSVEAVSATFSALFLTLKTAFPQMNDLTDDEKKALGEMWQPAFNLYLQNEKLAVIGIPILSTLGLFVPKILEARKKGKIAKSKDEGLLRQKELDFKNENRELEIKEEIKNRKIVESPQTKAETTFKVGEQSDHIVLPKREGNPDESN